MISRHHSARVQPANSGRVSTWSTSMASASETLSPMGPRALSGSLVRAMRSKYPEPGIWPWLPGGGQPGRRRAASRVSHYTDSYDQHVSVPGDGQAGGHRARRWLVLAAGTVALTVGSALQYGLAYLIPALRASGLSLAQAGVIVACPPPGLLLTLGARGAPPDRGGEPRGPAP